MKRREFIGTVLPALMLGDILLGGFRERNEEYYQKYFITPRTPSEQVRELGPCFVKTNKKWEILNAVSFKTPPKKFDRLYGDLEVFVFGTEEVKSLCSYFSKKVDGPIVLVWIEKHIPRQRLKIDVLTFYNCHLSRKKTWKDKQLGDSAHLGFDIFPKEMKDGSNRVWNLETKKAKKDEDGFLVPLDF